MSVRAVVVETYPFSGMAKLLAEDGRWLAFTRLAAGAATIELREGLWLTCELAPDRSVLSVRVCPSQAGGSAIDPEDDTPFVQESERRVAHTVRHAPTLHRVAGPDQVPVIWLSCWQVSEFPWGARFVWGWDERGREGRSSTLLAHFDAAEARLRSISGRHYQLVGPPCVDADAEYVWECWLASHGYSKGTLREVTADVWQAIQAAANAQRPAG